MTLFLKRKDAIDTTYPHKGRTFCDFPYPSGRRGHCYLSMYIYAVSGKSEEEGSSFANSLYYVVVIILTLRFPFIKKTSMDTVVFL